MSLNIPWMGNLTVQIQMICNRVEYIESMIWCQWYLFPHQWYDGDTCPPHRWYDSDYYVSLMLGPPQWYYALIPPKLVQPDSSKQLWLQCSKVGSTYTVNPFRAERQCVRVYKLNSRCIPATPDFPCSPFQIKLCCHATPFVTASSCKNSQCEHFII